MCNNSKKAKQYLGKTFCTFQNNYIKTKQVGVLVKNEANKIYDLEVSFEVYNQ